MDKKQLEKYSSAFTLSDMEIFIFPELLYALVLANIMSPEIWKWRDDKWFAGIDRMGPLKKIHRLKQYIMDHYSFNLDLDTWGLTDKQTEISRFEDFLDTETLQRSNALFGYEGDKYYFDIDIRKHFGLDKYDSDIIPYWKTETIEAMNAFRFKPGYTTGAGECVSLATLYAAALFVVAKVPLEKIYLLGTPLHSQNFILVDDGVLTNNRRIVTKPMWYNGTELSVLARRALEHEQITIVAHSTGYIHTIYPEATIGEKEYHSFRQKLSAYLETTVNFEIFTNFLRSASKYQKFFQLAFTCQDQTRYIRLEKAYAYEHGSKNRIGDKSARNLYCEIDEEDLSFTVEQDRAVIASDNFIFDQKTNTEFYNLFHQEFPALAANKEFMDDMKKFIHTNPKLPSSNKTFSPSHPITILPSDSREEIIDHLMSLRKESVTADLAFYAGRHMDSCDWKPYLKAAFERNPVSVDFFMEMDPEETYRTLENWPEESIYEGNRVALPDEVVNYKCGDGIEKAVTFINVMKARHIGVSVEQSGTTIHVKMGTGKYSFRTTKELQLPVTSMNYHAL
ncbi:MAG: hypothetical protein NTU98_06880 [Bacteroidetes bacterium]|nr:hypothetical protein [Bacteroidota bacterium]